MADGDRIVYRKENGKWADEAVGAERAATLFDTQEEAINSARARLERGTGGELIIKGEDGQIRRKLTIGSAKDPFPPRDTNR
ncbi:MAG: DUF2188 domain-containing protein [Anaerolineae bacterium]|nr:DUF2188 domain-containing protein [Anaerolineae bacterium]